MIFLFSSPSLCFLHRRCFPGGTGRRVARRSLPAGCPGPGETAGRSSGAADVWLLDATPLLSKIGEKTIRRPDNVERSLLHGLACGPRYIQRLKGKICVPLIFQIHILMPYSCIPKSLVQVSDSSPSVRERNVYFRETSKRLRRADIMESLFQES